LGSIEDGGGKDGKRKTGRDRNEGVGRWGWQGTGGIDSGGKIANPMAVEVPQWINNPK